MSRVGTKCGPIQKYWTALCIFDCSAMAKKRSCRGIRCPQWPLGHWIRCKLARRARTVRIVHVSGNLVPALRGCRWRTARKPRVEQRALYSTRQKRYCRRKGSVKDCFFYEITVALRFPHTKALSNGAVQKLNFQVSRRISVMMSTFSVSGLSYGRSNNEFCSEEGQNPIICRANLHYEMSYSFRSAVFVPMEF